MTFSCMFCLFVFFCTAMIFCVVPRLRGRRDHPACSRKEQCHVQDVCMTAPPNDTGDTADTIHPCWEAWKGHRVVRLWLLLFFFSPTVASEEMFFKSSPSPFSSFFPPATSPFQYFSPRIQRVVDVLRFPRWTADDGQRHARRGVIRKPACKQERLGGG